MRFAALFIMPFLIVTMMYATYMGTMHNPHPRDLPVAVIGQGQGPERFADRLEEDSLGGLEVRLVEDAEAAAELIAEQQIAGAIDVADGSGGTATIYRAMAGGASQAALVDQVLKPPALANGWDVESVDLEPLPAGDSSGTLVLFAAMGMMLAGYVPLSTMMMGTPNLLRVRKFLPIALGWGAFTSSVIWLILGPVVGAVEGHYPLFLGVGTLAVAAVGISQLFFTKVLGPFAVLLGMLLWVVFGVPSSNLAIPVHTLPEFFQWMHDVLPLPAAGEAIRSAIYFEGHGFGEHIATLLVWLVGALVLAVVKERTSGHLVVGGPVYTAPDAPLASLSGGPVASYRSRVTAAVLFPLSILVAVVTLMGLSMHQPTVQDMPVAVVAPTSQAEKLVTALEPQLGEYVDLRVVESSDAATDQIREQELVAAYVLPADPSENPTLLTAGGAGVSQQTAVASIMGRVASEAGADLVVEDLAPLTDDDVNGSNSLYVGMSWVMAGFLFFAVMRGGAPELRRTRQLLPLVAGWSVGISVWLWLLFDVLIGAVNGHAWEMIVFGAFTVFSVAWASAVVIRSVGLAGIIPVMIMVMLAGVPASGGGLSIYMVPGVFRPLADVLPLPAAVDMVRSLTYLDGVGVGGNLLALAACGGLGLLLNLIVVDRWVNRPGARPHAPMGPRHAPDRSKKELVGT